MNTIFKTESRMIPGLISSGFLTVIGLTVLLFLPSYAFFGFSALVFAIIEFSQAFFGTQQVIECSEEGFTLEKKYNYKVNTKEFFPWGRVLATKYYEKRRGKRSHCPHFEVYCDGRLAMKLVSIPNLSHLIEIFNAKTPQLPYTWEPRFEGNSTGTFVYWGQRPFDFCMAPRVGEARPSGQKIPPPPLPSQPSDPGTSPG